MKAKIFAAACALALAVPAVSMANRDRVPQMNQFGGQAAGIIQGMGTGDDFKAESFGGEHNTQGGNVVKGNVDKGILQGAYVGDDLKLTMKGGERNTQGLNVVSGKVVSRVGQLSIIEDDVKMKSVRGDHNTQGVNVVNACEGCQ